MLHSYYHGGSDRSSRGRVGFWSRAGLSAGVSGLTGWPCYLIGRREEDRERELLEGTTRIGLESDHVEYKYCCGKLSVISAI